MHLLVPLLLLLVLQKMRSSREFCREKGGVGGGLVVAIEVVDRLNT